MTHPIEFTHPLWGAGLILDYRDGLSFLAFPGSLKLTEELSPSELIWRSHRGQI